jgi:DNA-binding PadR family transcriptional regulator
MGILNKQPSYGYDLKRTYDKLFGKDKPLTTGYLYATLARLHRDNKIAGEETDGLSGGPERKQFALTKLGKEDLARWLATPEYLHPNTQSVLYSKVVTSLLVDEDPGQYLDSQRMSHLKRMHELTVIRDGGDPAQILQADYDLFHLEADLRWIDITVARLEILKREIRNE